MTLSVDRLRERLVRLGLRLGQVAPWFPAGWRSKMVQNLTSELLIQAIGNLESRDDFFWLRREVWRLAHRVLGLDDGCDRFSACGWPLALETDIAKAIFMPAVAYHYRLRRPGIIEPIDQLLRERWAECCDSSVWSARDARRTERRAREIDRRWRAAAPGVAPASSVLPGLSQAVRRRVVGGDGDWGLIVARRGFLASGTYEPVLRALRDLGLAVLWVELGDELGERGDPAVVTAREHPWGVELRPVLPTPEELIAASGRAATEYREVLDRVRDGYRRLPEPLGWVRSCVESGLPISAHRWLAASAIAERLLDEIPVRFVQVLADKDAVARAFVMAARARRIETSYYYRALELGPPSYWPIADRILVANAARVERLGELGVPRERVVAVGSLEIDRLLETTQKASRDTSPPARVNVLLLTKWPASLFFGDSLQLGCLVSEIARLAPEWHWIVKPHPKDATDYSGLSAGVPGQVEVRRDSYPELVADATLAVSAMGNPVFHALAIGKPLIVFNPDQRINLGHDRLFARRDLPPQVRFAESRDALRAALQGFVSGRIPLMPYEVAPSMVTDLFHALDGGTAERIAATLVGAATPVLAEGDRRGTGRTS